MNVAFLLLCSRRSQKIIELLDTPYFNHPDNVVYVHFDLSSPVSEYDKLKNKYDKRNDILFVNDRIECRWGEYSLVDATLKLFRAALENKNFEPDYLYLISESCFPIKTFAALQEFLKDNRNTDFTQAVDPTIKQWSVGGYEMDRLRYRYPFNYKKNRRVFELFKKLQTHLKIEVKTPQSLPVRFGSQWMAIRRQTAKTVLDKFQNTKLVNFLRYTWIPDEFAIQSIIADVTPPSEIANRTLTYYEFDKDGLPIVQYNDSAEKLAKQPHFFARKRSDHADKLISNVLSLETASKNIQKNPKLILPNPNFQIFQRNLKSSRAVVGGIDNEWWHPVDKITRQYYCVSGISPVFIMHLLGKVNSWGHQRAHGYIFDKSEIHDFDNRVPFDSNYVNIRNYSPGSFLYDIVMRSEKEVIFAFDWNDLEYVADRIPYHSFCNVFIVDPFPKAPLIENLVFRLTNTEAKSIVQLPSYRIKEEIHKQFEKDDIGFWDRKSDTGYNCTLLKIDNDVSGVGDGIRAAIRETDVLSLFSKEHQKLLDIVQRAQQ